MKKRKHYNNMDALDIIHNISNIYTSTKKPKDYGTGEIYTHIEVHTLKDISDYPGITVTELARNQGKTKGAISQILKKLEKCELIYREVDPNNENRLFVYITEKGKMLDKKHRENDRVGFGESMDKVREIYTDEEIDNALEIMEYWLNIRRDIQDQRDERKKALKKKKK